MKAVTNKFNNPYKVMATGSGWYLFKKTEQSNDYVKVEGFGCRQGDRVRALEMMYQLNGWNLPKGGLH